MLCKSCYAAMLIMPYYVILEVNFWNKLTEKSKKNLALHELHNAFFSLKSSKWSEYDDISSNIVKAASNEVFSTTKQLFNISLKRRFSRQTQDCLCHSYF